MSSHHIIRDNQEPALIIANGQSCSHELMAQLLEWSPYILVLDGAVQRVLSLDIHMDAVLGDLDSLSASDADILNARNIPVIHAADQSKTDLQKGLEFLIQKGHKAVNILWGTGMRADHTFHNICSLAWYQNSIQACLLDDHSRIYVLPKVFEKQCVPGSVFSLIPIGEVKGIQTEGLKFPLHNGILDVRLNTGSSNEADENGMVKISYESGTLLAMECNDL